MKTAYKSYRKSGVGLTALKNMLISFCLLVMSHTQFGQVAIAADNAASNSSLSADIRRFQTQGDFNDTKDFLLQAIAGRGIKVSSTSYISKMLQRTREDVGGGALIFKNAEAIGFCSATLSRQMMESDPHHIVFCPYTIVIYELERQPGTIYFSYRRPFYSDTSNQDSTLKEIDSLMAGIITEVVE